MTRQFPVEFSISWQSCIIGALMILILPLRLLAAAFCAAAIHECCHFAVLKLFRVRIYRITVGSGGAVIQTAPLPPLQELLCALAGPAGSFLCLFGARQLPLLALCGFVQGVYNLLPIYPLDGGRVLLCCCELCIPQWADKVSGIVSRLIGAAVVGISVFLFLRTMEVFFLLFAGYFLFNTALSRKTPCKEVRY